MAYLGNVPARSFISFERQVFTIVNSQTAYTLSHSVTNENDIRLVVNNVVQEPGSGKAYTASGTTLTLSAALTNGTDEMYCVFLGRAVGTVNAPAGSINNSQISYPLTQSGATVSTLNRTTNNGDILEIQRLGTTVGSIGTPGSGSIYFTEATYGGLAFSSVAAGDITPCTPTGAIRDNATSLGQPSARFKDAYISQGVFLGGTGTANQLDDYEEGTWTPTYVPDSGSFSSVTYASTAGEYTKIGNTVYFTFYIQTNAITVGSASSYVKIGGLPFAPGGGTTSNGGGTVINASFFAGDKPFYGTVGGSSEIFLYYSTGSTANDSLLDVSDLGTGGTDNVFQMMGTYITTA